MCSIIGSFDIDKYKELYELNSYRGTLTSSFTVLDEDGDIVTLNRFSDTTRMFNIIDDVIFQGDTGCYYLGHSQAPTTQGSLIHPAENDTALLWHNGIIKEKEIAQWNEKLKTDFVWDTELILYIVQHIGVEALSDLDGSFACVLYSNKQFFVFRNAIAPLFYDDELNISSTKFSGSKSVLPHRVFLLNLETKTLDETEKVFTTKNNPYLL